MSGSEGVGLRWYLIREDVGRRIVQIEGGEDTV